MTKRNMPIAIVAYLLALLATYIPSTTSASDYHQCNPVDVGIFAERIHVKCDPPGLAMGPGPGGGAPAIKFFAVSTENPEHAGRVLSLLTTALVLGKPMRIAYSIVDDESGIAIGCQKHDCRLIHYIILPK